MTAVGRMLDLPTQSACIVTLLVPILLGALLFFDLRRIDKKSNWEGALPNDVKKRIEKGST